MQGEGTITARGHLVTAVDLFYILEFQLVKKLVF